MSNELTRRRLLGSAAAVAGGTVAATALTELLANTAAVAGGRRPSRPAPRPYAPYGALRPTKDQNGEVWLALPPGFQYVTFSHTGTPMSDGTLTPQHHDGMRAYRTRAGLHGRRHRRHRHGGKDQVVRLVRNHEITASRPTTAVPFPVGGPEATRYDALAKGGTVTVDFDMRTGRVLRDFVSSNGTLYNCSGGLSLDGRHWLTCEETTHGTHRGYEQDHGYVFQVPVDASAPTKGKPIKAMGRFNHEAVVVDPRTGIHYLTEDRFGAACGFYRFLPRNPRDLLAGGTLQMLAITGKDAYDTRKGQRVHRSLPVRWVTIDEPDAGYDDAGDFTKPFPYPMRHGQVAGQGFAGGAAAFDRLEGAFWSGCSVFFTSTSGGDAPQNAPNAFRDEFTGGPYVPGYGQVWEYVPGRRARDGGMLRLVFESPGNTVLDSPDGVTVTPRGGLVLCEDDTAWTDGDTHPLAPGISNPNRLVGLGRNGRPFDFAVQTVPLAPNGDKGDSTSNEFAGATFSPDGTTLFVNLYGNDDERSGMTAAITGPWRRGPL